LNSLIKEGAYIAFNRKRNFEEEKKSVMKWIDNHGKEEFHIVVECDGKIVGKGEFGRLKEVSNHVAEVGISLLKEYRGLGIGRIMLKYLIMAARKTDLKYLKLHVFAKNKRAITLYKQEGFKEYGRLPKQGKFKDKFVDEIVMLKKL
jgi:L-amino acid N-acyltransferase YncA